MILSIIVPVYNVEAFLKECLDSVFIQDLTDCEVILVNDGSTDGSSQILSEYKLLYDNILIFEQRNKGLSSARNTGLISAKGEFVYFLDSDDYLLPNAICEIKKSISKSNAEVLFFNALVDGEKELISSFIVDEKLKTGIDFFEDFKNDNLEYPHVNVPLFVYKRSFLSINKLIFKEGLYHEDILFSMLVFFYTKSIWASNIFIFNYRQNRLGSICTNVKVENLIDKSMICRSLDTFFIEHNFINKYFNNSLFNHYLYTLNQSKVLNVIKLQKLFFCNIDKGIMKKGVLNDYEYKLWKLATINLTLMNRYYTNKLPIIIRRFLNILFSFILKLNRSNLCSPKNIYQ